MVHLFDNAHTYKYIQMIYNAHNVKQNDWIWGADSDDLTAALHVL